MMRRTFLGMGATALATGCGRTRPPRTKSAVVILKAASYSADLLDPILLGIAQCGLDVKGKRVLLKPNFVEFSASTCINTSPAVVAAAVEAFEKLGAAQVLIGEGPGHRRDTYALAEEAGYWSAVPRFEDRFTDLNRDDVSPVEHFGGLPRIYLPNTALGADLVVSVAKMKTHHWAGVTLSMKNLFGLVPGSIYGWPKNTLHLNNIDRSVFELNRIFRKTFAIVDGIVGMEGDGPILGRPKAAGVLVLGADLAAVDATCCRVMGIAPSLIGYLRLAAQLGNTEAADIEQRGEKIESVRSDFALIRKFSHLRPL